MVKFSYNLASWMVSWSSYFLMITIPYHRPVGSDRVFCVYCISLFVLIELIPFLCVIVHVVDSFLPVESFSLASGVLLFHILD